MVAPPDRVIGWRHWAAVAAITALSGLALYLMGRVLICACGHVDLWTGDPNSSDNSQHLTDWYTPSHVLHGLMFYLAARYLMPGFSFGSRLVSATAVEAAWEVIENTPLIIDRYREVTVALGYYGDSVINSTMDVLAMVAGFLIAARLPVWASVALFVAAELFVGWAIRDNLTLNVLMLLWPLESVRTWQAGG